ncbi:ABC transporter ATP-binding protein [Humitalea sp. 24SJ18S-53]|uniref:ABC transporter ATP-binding protein n=1 Tax=Humitalea sp. 24SJ18S-53 TaxID=3422307 RepID=UPI003D67EA9C
MSIEVSGLIKRFGSATAVAGVDISLPAGSMLVLLGPSGCGKTTTMRCIAGLESPDEGVIGIHGTTVFDRKAGIDVPVYRRRIGMVFQSYAIWPHLTVFENVSFPLEMQQTPKAELRDRTMEMLEKVGLADYAKRGASALSGGQMQRVALARSLVMRPAVLLFDEPLSNLDARLRDRLRVQLRELQSELGITGIYVTHDQQEALALADSIMVMEHGSVRQTGGPVDLYRAPRSAAIAAFLGYSNIFPATEWRAVDGGAEVTLASGRRLHASGDLPPRGAPASLCVRPEQLGLRSATADESPDAILGEITLASFLGATTLYRVRSTGGEVWEALTDQVVPGLVKGSTVVVEPAPGALRLLPQT